MASVLLIAPPYKPPSEATLALALLRPLLEAADHQVREIHGSLHLSIEGYQTASAMFDWNARHAFGHALAGERMSAAAFVDHALRSMKSDLDPHGLVGATGSQTWAAYGVDEEQIRADMHRMVDRVEACLASIVAAAVAMGPFDVVGFSTMFADQMPAAVVIARRLRQVWPKARIVFGGAGCAEEQGEGLLASFPVVDVACTGEGEQVIAPLVQALASGASPSDVPGVAWRDGDVVRRNPSPPLLRDLDSLPMPDYREFLAQLSASAWRDEPADLFFETSRGCWWGQKSLCTFCGLNGEGLPYRSKSPERAVDEIRRLHGAYHEIGFLRAVDNILDVRYIDEVLPALSDLASHPERPLRMFFEVKSNMRPAQIQTLVAGGIREVQPGIESFSDEILALMRKGSTALGQVQFVKWAAEAGLELAYNILVLNPGEKTAWYRDMLALIPFIAHLPPPQQTSNMILERFSPYHLTPARYGIRNVRPRDYFHQVFGDDADSRLAYKFDYDHAMFDDAEHLAAVRALATALRRWRDDWRPYTAYHVELGEPGQTGPEVGPKSGPTGGLVIIDRRSGREERTRIAGVAARVFRFLDRHRTLRSIQRQFSGIATEFLDTLLLVWLHQRWICQNGDRYLAVLPRRGPGRRESSVKGTERLADEAVMLETARPSREPPTQLPVVEA